MTCKRTALTSILWSLCLLVAAPWALAQQDAKPQTADKATETPSKGKEEAPAKAEEEKKTDPAPGEKSETMPEKEAAAGDDDEAVAEQREADAGIPSARPITSDPVQVYGWREWVQIGDSAPKMPAKLDSGARTSSLHVEEKELFERDGRKWVRFIVTDPREDKSPRTRIEAPLVRIAHVKEPGGEPQAREVVRLNFTIGDRKMRAEFTLNDRSNMLNPVLIGRSTITELGWIDPSRAYLADQKIMR